jgi:putative FmdB family regulatory protein
MPIYDVQCSECGFEDTLSLAISEVSQWDQQAQCPSCKESRSNYRRILKKAPAAGGKSRPKAQLKSGDRDAMRHKEFLRRNPDQIASAVESVKKGEFEGF